MNNTLRQTGRFIWNYSIFFSFCLLLVFNASASVQVDPGTEQTLSGNKIFTWEKLAGNEVTEAGVTIPFAVLENPPIEPGSGPAGAIAVVDFSQIVRNTTFLNHFELNWEKDGHEPPVFMVPHFDFHFYNIPPSEVFKISAPDPQPPRANLIPEGYIYPGAEHTIPQMGVHAVRPADLERPFTDVLIFGYYGGNMTFIEPMVTRSALLKQQPVTYTVPVPPAMGKTTRFPTKFRIEHDVQAKACRLIFSHFTTTTP